MGLEVGDSVEIISGPFRDFPATVVGVDEAKDEISVKASVFGRDTQITLASSAVSK